MVEFENSFDDFIMQRCNSIIENLMENNREIKNTKSKIKCVTKNSDEYFNLHSDIQNIVEKEIYRQAFKDGLRMGKEN